MPYDECSGLTASLHCDAFYIDGRWCPAPGGAQGAVVDPATETRIATVALGTAKDVDKAVSAAGRAFPAWAALHRTERIALLERICAAYERRMPEMAALITAEMGAPSRIALRAQAASGLAHLQEAVRVLEGFDPDEQMGTTLVTREPIGVCALITPWNWPMNQIACKVAPALAAGCTMVLKPSELSPLSALLFAEILDEAGLPPGVFNLVNGTGDGVGAALSAHPAVDLVSFTGSNRAGTAIAQAAATTVKRLHLELGGKSPNILLDDVDLAKAVPAAVRACFANSGQSCDAPTRLLVPQDRLAEAEALATNAANALRVGDPQDAETFMGPVANAAQFDRVQAMIASGIAEGARIVAGGPGRPEGLGKGYYVRPTVFSGLTSDMRILCEEVFGPVLCLQGYTSEADALRLANDTPYGLSSYVSSADPDRARRFARGLRAGMVHINGAPSDFAAPFGGYKASGNGSEWGRYGFEGYLEVKSIFGHG
ncbi:aldehyde dehydrogenase family protein [Paracoccus aestuariivivens]|uniref:Aldehyde dehydrogenase family protein n=1 Tax=Paracoccus aestuariivivens TaxID=1820333 RepID=A0A6L6JCS4_9RHOB|nr:aldehyde dehydrogenase family protein [Paracoccus aestuariivivens]MTH80003.1 aldehyde dehydrogenase family protein [Paracoccus aestuariivivens]